MSKTYKNKKLSIKGVANANQKVTVRNNLIFGKIKIRAKLKKL